MLGRHVMLLEFKKDLACQTRGHHKQAIGTYNFQNGTNKHEIQLPNWKSCSDDTGFTSWKLRFYPIFYQKWGSYHNYKNGSLQISSSGIWISASKKKLFRAQRSKYLASWAKLLRHVFAESTSWRCREGDAGTAFCFGMKLCKDWLTAWFS